MPSTDGCGEQLFSSMIEAGTQNMRLVLWMNNKMRMKIQVNASIGVADEPAMTSRNGEVT
ncbi:hypothetical protein RRF57_012589 [Xylaria bambusicola]|uniref:Uncharacterized protein n=1 Tax=Xylaria bambusicola TaxID=326684 RepID=A0AAN7ZAU3_9PEZI